MKLSKKYLVEVDENGCLHIPPELAVSFGLKPGAKIVLQQEDKEIRFARPVKSLARVYIEPTNRFNLDCVTCMRNVSTGWIPLLYAPAVAVRFCRLIPVTKVARKISANGIHVPSGLANISRL